MTSHHPYNFDQLNGLRGIAALIVIVSHSANAGFLPSILGVGFGQIGVCLFFILSGFLMGHLYLGQSFSKQIFHQYIIKRAARVLPLFFFCLFLAVFAHVAFHRNIYNIQSINDILANIFLVHGTSVLWSIPVEIHFYLTFIFIWLALTHGLGIGRVLFIISYLQIFTVLILERFSISNNFLPFWMHIFVFGILISIGYQRFSLIFLNMRGSRLLSWLSWLVAFGIVLSLPELRRILGIKVFFAAFDPIIVGYSALVFFLTLLDIGPFKFLSDRSMQYLGRISFSLYLLHMPTLMAIKSLTITENRPFLGFFITLSATILFSTITFYGVEKPAQSCIRRLFLRNPRIFFL